MNNMGHVSVLPFSCMGLVVVLMLLYVYVAAYGALCMLCAVTCYNATCTGYATDVYIYMSYIYRMKAYCCCYDVVRGWCNVMLLYTTEYACCCWSCQWQGWWYATCIACDDIMRDTKGSWPIGGRDTSPTPVDARRCYVMLVYDIAAIVIWWYYYDNNAWSVGATPT
jgi:hypothetical protein